jgi:hypothetical protein
VTTRGDETPPLARCCSAAFALAPSPLPPPPPPPDVWVVFAAAARALRGCWRPAAPSPLLRSHEWRVVRRRTSDDGPAPVGKQSMMSGVGGLSQGWGRRSGSGSGLSSGSSSGLILSGQISVVPASVASSWWRTSRPSTGGQTRRVRASIDTYCSAQPATVPSTASPLGCHGLSVKKRRAPAPHIVGTPQ